MTRRTRMETTRQTLEILEKRGPLNVYKIQYAIETNYNATRDLLLEMGTYGLIEANSPTFKITDKGRKVLAKYNELKELIAWR